MGAVIVWDGGCNGVCVYNMVVVIWVVVIWVGVIWVGVIWTWVCGLLWAEN